MKHVVSMCIAVFFIISVFSCRTAVETAKAPEDAPKADLSIPLGWIDGDTFRAMATGSTKDSAISGAQLAVIEKFIIERVKISGPNADPKSTGVAIVNEFGGTVKGGAVIREKLDEGGKLRIIYEVKSGNLKNRVRGRN